ncbi:hypothetical protein RRG08_063989 [Elysia crispata]|uniref:Uncharacterized protein n=1 Tax=Elysia crispata TaxID=231223 RepID=A0AAE0YFF5_9GAST|nr:hypothetical protein RRG08_063989 [Elysia crispata]
MSGSMIDVLATFLARVTIDLSNNLLVRCSPVCALQSAQALNFTTFLLSLDDLKADVILGLDPRPIGTGRGQDPGCLVSRRVVRGVSQPSPTISRFSKPQPRGCRHGDEAGSMRSIPR